MKRILLFLLLFVNLQIVFHNGILDCSFTSVYAQHMTREAGDNCYDAEIGWYHSPFSDCRDVEVTPKKCQYCGTSFDTDLAVLQHEKDCSSKPKDYECSYCHSGFDDLSSLNTHENQCPERFKCYRCGNGFSSQYDLDNHTCGGQNNQGGGGSTGGKPSGGQTGGKPSGGQTGGKPSSSGTGGSTSGSNTNVKFSKEKYLKASKEVYANLNNLYPKTTVCNLGLQEMSKKLYGKILDELKGNANTIYNNLEKSSKWHKIDYTKANEYANKGYFVVAAWNSGNSSSGHVDTILPGHTGSTWSDIYVMDTGYAPWTTSTGQSGNSRSEEQNIKNSFGSNKRTGKTGSFGIYYYE
ncbi:MAG: hypothetical protein KBT34_12455 [Prevotella sp.]|nr:hypothetical protein [Candidatus Prevotella equi]